MNREYIWKVVFGSLDEDERSEPAIVLFSPRVLVPVGLLTGLWVFKARIVSALVGKILGLNVHVRGLDLRITDIGNVVVSLKKTRLFDDSGREALFLPALHVEIDRQEQSYLIDVEAVKPVISVHFDNYILTKNNWRSLLAASLRRRAEKERYVDDEGRLHVGSSVELCSVMITGFTVLRTFSEPLDRQPLIDPIELRGVSLRPADFQSLEKTVEFVEYLTAKTVLTVDRRRLPRFVRDNLVRYARAIARKEGVHFPQIGKIDVNELSTTLDYVDSRYGELLSPQIREAIFFGRQLLTGSPPTQDSGSPASGGRG